MTKINKKLPTKYINPADIACYDKIQYDIPFDKISISGKSKIKETPLITKSAKKTNLLKDIDLLNLELPKLWSLGITGKGVTIAHFDGGVHAHPDLTKDTKPEFIKFPDGHFEPIFPPENIAKKGAKFAVIDLIYGKNKPWENAPLPNYCMENHGSYTAGKALSSGKSTNGKHCGAAPEANLISFRVIGDDPETFITEKSPIEKETQYNDNIIYGLNWCIKNKEKYNIRVISLSIGSFGRGIDNPVKKAVKSAWDAGILCVIAAGNSGEKIVNSETGLIPETGNINPLGDSPFSLTVGGYEFPWSIDFEDKFQNGQINYTPDRNNEFYSGMTSRGMTNDGIIKPDILAPCNHCWGPQRNDGYERWDAPQTSTATPIVAGIVADLFQAFPEASPSDIKEALMKTAKPMWPFYPDHRGTGRMSTLISASLKVGANLSCSPVSNTLALLLTTYFPENEISPFVKNLQTFLMKDDKDISYLTPNDQGKGAVYPIEAYKYLEKKFRKKVSI